MTAPEIQAQNLKRTFGTTKAVDGVDLSVERGEIYGFLGPNGAGKSTVTHLACWPMTICLFDLDGTLVDSTKPVLAALNTALGDLGLEPVTADDLSTIIGPPLRATFVTLVAERGGDEAMADRLLDTYRTGYRKTSTELAAAYPGVPELLESLRDHTRLGVVTSKPMTYAIPILDALGFSPMMEVMEGPGLSETEAKPATLARALHHLGVVSEIDSIFMIGDRYHDIEAGQSAGVRTIGVTWGFGNRDELSGAGADYVVDTPDEIGTIALG